jgi:hypothetical protein
VAGVAERDQIAHALVATALVRQVVDLQVVRGSAPFTIVSVNFEAIFALFLPSAAL